MTTPPRPQSLAGIKDGILHIQVDLLSPQGDLKAHGFLGKAAFMVEEFFADQQAESLTAALEAKATEEKAKIDKGALHG